MTKGPEQKNWSQVDQLLCKSLLIDDRDVCYYYLIRTPGGFWESETNSRIHDLKKDPAKYRANPQVWQYKQRAIAEFAQDLSEFFVLPSIASLVQDYQPAYITPMPTSKPKGHPGYDSRIVDICEKVAMDIPGLTVYDAFDVDTALTPAHQNGTRNPTEIQGHYRLSPAPVYPAIVFLVDDVVVTGAHFVACRNILAGAYPRSTLVGLFLSLHKSDKRDYGGAL